ncbi:MAG: transposase family protein [Terriglobales bacterium]|jgi:hypothetical protein
MRGVLKEAKADMDNPQQYFASLDPRVEKNREHLLVEIPLTAIASVLSGAESRNDREEYGKPCFPVGYRRDEDGGGVCAGLRRYLMETLPRRWLSMAANSSIAAGGALHGNTGTGSL